MTAAVSALRFWRKQVWVPVRGLDWTSLSMLEAVREFESALHHAVPAALPLRPSERPAFIGKHLIAQLDGAPLPRAESGVPVDHSTLSPLAQLLTMVLNRSCGAPGWPTRAVADTLVAMSPEVAEVLLLGEAPPALASVSFSSQSEGPSSPDPLKYSAIKPGETRFKKGLSFLDVGTRDRGGNARPHSLRDSRDSLAAADDGPPPRTRSSYHFGATWRRASLMQRWSSSASLRTVDKRTSLRDSMRRTADVHTRRSFEESLPGGRFTELKRASVRAQTSTNEIERAKHIADLARDAFVVYDSDKSGTIDKAELFNVMTELGQVRLRRSWLRRSWLRRSWLGPSWLRRTGCGGAGCGTD